MNVKLITAVLAIIAFGLSDAFLFVSRNPNNIRFLLFKDYKNPDESIKIPYNASENVFLACGYNESRPLIILLHDILSNSQTPNDIQLIKNAYLEENLEANIVVADYGKLTTSNIPSALFFAPVSSALNKLASRFNSNIVAKRIAEFIFHGIRAKVISGPEDIHIVGFGLGAHIAGATGRVIIETLLKPIRRITGLDPSRQFPLLKSAGLDESDAYFVDVTYTSAIADVGVRRGHVQFYLNGGGPHQPNCPLDFPFKERYCSHSTAVYYFAKSVKKKNIGACKCKRCRRPKYQPKECSWNSLTAYGQFLIEGVRGNFYVGLN